ncbi:hypothetical protein T01_4511 [Trichinella spiralis]|uniref:Uncharacterized protein n=1 Tax=Trichinella spiralis TaxID=6334 RepID=A0A0V1ATX9_TRISP|nr:hypothetical protein T01_4511 [Trichinella spiralis]
MIVRRVSLPNNDRREQKETLSSIWKIPCQAIMFCVSEKRPSSNSKFCIYQSRLAIKVAVAGERAQSPFGVVFSAVVALRCSCVCLCACL